MTIGYDASLGTSPRSPTSPTQVQGQGRPQRRPDQGSRRLQWRRPRRRGERRLRRRHPARHRLLQDARRQRQPDPGRPGPGHDRVGPDPDRHRLVLQQRPADRRPRAEGHHLGVVVPSDAAPVAAYYNSAINKDAAHPAAARCWIEYVFSDAGQNTWLKGFALPVRLAAMQTAGTADKDALAASTRRPPPRSADPGADRRGQGGPRRAVEVHHHQVGHERRRGGAAHDRSIGISRARPPRRRPPALPPAGPAEPLPGGGNTSPSSPSMRTSGCS